MTKKLITKKKKVIFKIKEKKAQHSFNRAGRLVKWRAPGAHLDLIGQVVTAGQWACHLASLSVWL